MEKTMQSMTGYGFSEVHQGEYQLQVEVKALNNRYLETRIHLQEMSNRFEILLLKRVQDRIRRGRLDLYVSCNRNLSSYRVTPDLELAREYLQAWKEIYQGLGIQDTIPVDSLLSKDEIVRVERLDSHDEDFQEMMMEAVDGALDNLQKMRRKEGERLKREILQAVHKTERIRERIASCGPQIVEAYRKKLTQRLEELLQGRGDVLDEDRLAFEVAVLAERSDITEELARIDSHLSQLKETLSLQDQPLGRKIDFIAQELHREINTISAKAMDMEIVNGAMEMKSQIDGIREQAKNIE